MVESQGCSGVRPVNMFGGQSGIFGTIRLKEVGYRDVGAYQMLTRKFTGRHVQLIPAVTTRGKTIRSGSQRPREIKDESINAFVSHAPNCA